MSGFFLLESELLKGKKATYFYFLLPAASPVLASS